MEATEATAEELYDQTFIEQPAILDKYKAAAVIADGKYKYILYINFFHIIFGCCWCSLIIKHFNTTKYCNFWKYLSKNIYYLAALEKAIELSIDGADVSTICGIIDNFIEEEL